MWLAVFSGCQAHSSNRPYSVRWCCPARSRICSGKVKVMKSKADKLRGSFDAVRKRVGEIRLAGHLAPRLSPMAA